MGKNGQKDQKRLRIWTGVRTCKCGRDVHREVQEGVVCLAAGLAGEAGDAGLERAPEHGRHHGVGLGPIRDQYSGLDQSEESIHLGAERGVQRQPHLVVHARQQVQQLRVQPVHQSQLSIQLTNGRPVSPVQHVSEELVSVLLLVTTEPRHHFPDRLEQTLRRDACILLITLRI